MSLVYVTLSVVVQISNSGEGIQTTAFVKADIARRQEKKKDISNQQRNSTQFFGPTKHWTEKIYNFKDWPFNHLPGSMLTYAFFFFVCFFSSIVRGFPVVCAF